MILKFDETVARSLLFVLNIYMLNCCVLGENLACLRTMAKKSALTQTRIEKVLCWRKLNI